MDTHDPLHKHNICNENYFQRHWTNLPLIFASHINWQVFIFWDYRPLTDYFSVRNCPNCSFAGFFLFFFLQAPSRIFNYHKRLTYLPLFYEFQIILQTAHFIRHHLILFHDGGSYHIETSPLICRTSQWTGFCMIGVSIIKTFNPEQ